MFSLTLCKDYMGTCGFWVGNRPNRRLQINRCLENLSSGEKRAGCADSVGRPSGASFLSVYTRLPSSSMYTIKCMAARDGRGVEEKDPQDTRPLKT